MKYLRRMMSYLAVRLIHLTMSESKLVCAYYIAYNLENAYVLISEGMEKRASVVLTREDAVALNGYFTTGFLNSDPLLEIAFSDASPYLSHTIKSFDYSAKIENLMAWPWDNDIQCTVVERVKNITASSSSSGQITPWASGRYFIRLRKQANGQWKIASMRSDPDYIDPGEMK